MEEKLKDMLGKRPEELEGETLKLFEAIMEIADERDELRVRNKELEEENKTKLEVFELGKESSRKRIEYDYIPKSKIKEKIEELNEIEKEMHENKNHSNDINEIYKYAVEEDKAKYGAIFLQDLLKRTLNGLIMLQTGKQ